MSEEKKIYKENIIVENVFEFAYTCRFIQNKLYESSRSHIHQNDKYILEGKLYELIARLRSEPFEIKPIPLKETKEAKETKEELKRLDKTLGVISEKLNNQAQIIIPKVEEKKEDD